MKRLLLSLAAVLLFVHANTSAQNAMHHSIASTANAGVAIEHDSTRISVTAGAPILYALVARDSALQVVDDWQDTGHDITLVVQGSHAETDSSAQSWNGDALAYSWLTLTVNGVQLPLDSSIVEQRDARLYYTIAKSQFTVGRADLVFTQSGSDDDIVLSVHPRREGLVQDSPPISVLPGTHENYLVDLTCLTQGADTVFLLRPFEFIIVPRDRYLNYINHEIVTTTFTARFPAEFKMYHPAEDNIFTMPEQIMGFTNFFVVPRIRRSVAKGEELQWIRATRTDDPRVSGQCDVFEIIDHAPNPFKLLQPPDWMELKQRDADWIERFTWERADPQDPYSEIQLSRFSPERYSDQVSYKIRILDAETLTRAVVYDSDNSGRDTCFTTKQGQLAEMMFQLSRSPTIMILDVIWYVEAYDGVFVAASSPPRNDAQNRDGFRLQLRIQWGTSVNSMSIQGFSLHQNYPNPFNPTTTIQYTLHKAKQVTLIVTDLYGREVRRLLNSHFTEAGSHRVQFEAAGLPSGVYFYSLIAGGQRQSRKMVVLR